MRKKYSSIGLSILLLAGLIVGAAFWVRVFLVSVQSYRSPLQEADLKPQSSSPAQTDQVVIVLVSGLGFDAVQTLTLPKLEQLGRAGANLSVESSPPTYSQTAWATLVTGAPPDTNDAPPVDLAPDNLRPLEIDTIFARAQEANLRAVLLGSSEWEQLIPGQHLDDTVFVGESGPEADQAIFEAALPFIENRDAQLMLIHFTQVDFAAQNQGGTSGEAFQQAAGRIDTYLDQIRKAMDFNHSVLLILSDHGHTAGGGHGGNEVEVIWQPLLMIGKSVIPGEYSDIYQTDIAPTISTLLGLPAPTAAQGRILFETLQLSEYDQTLIQLSLAQQRVALAEAYAAQIQGGQTSLPGQLSTDLARAQTAFITNNIDGALQLAFLAQEEADRQFSAVKNHRRSSEQSSRLILAITAVFLWFAIMWRRRGFHAGATVIAAVVVIVSYHTLYQLQGFSYSLSSVSNFSELPFNIARQTAVSLLLGGGLLLIFLLMTKEGDWLTLLGTGYGFGVLVTFAFALPLFWTYWQNGMAVTWYVPAVVPAFWQLTSLFAVMSSGILGLLLPWPIMTFCLFVHLVRRRLNATQTQTAPDILPGLH